MRVIYNSDQLQLDNNNILISIFEKINELIKIKDTIFSHLIVDGVEIYEEHEAYIKERMDSIFTIEIVTRSEREMIYDSMKSIDLYLERAIPTLKELVEESYENFSSKTWNGINQLAEGMQWILNFFGTANSVTKKPAFWVEMEDSKQICEQSFIQLMGAIENNDTVLIVDILSYEITPAYETLKSNLAKSIKHEEFIKDVN